ncbi:BfmA/BtgA family mobilization protein [Leeuwenhoekiella marinoflava]|uniref:BfmA/BtgA family mobilization protein n=1 Tax=Leeuwenhoekiella marinoflava TaxID=988 RepID=UPI0030035A2C
MGPKFSRINFHTETVERFKKYAIANDANYTETLEAILDFFEKYSINPFVPFDDSIHSLHLLIDKRMDALEHILRTIEKEQLKPTKELLERLFQKEKEENLIVMKDESELDDAKFEDWDGKDF